MAPRPDSDRLAAVTERRTLLLEPATLHGAEGVALCGSVARGEDHDGSDIDFFVHNFHDADGIDARMRATQLVKDFRRILAPHEVDVLGIPGYITDPPYEASMRRDSIDLRTLSDPN